MRRILAVVWLSVLVAVTSGSPLWQDSLRSWQQWGQRFGDWGKSWGNGQLLSTCVPNMNYISWESIQYAFVFGDSYTSTGFNFSLTQPSPGNPLGNPAYPGFTSSNGPNWIDFLTVKYNQSVMQTFNFAYGGATVDTALVQPYLPTVLSMKEQVLNEFVPGYTGQKPSVPQAPNWLGSNSLFAFWIGINDVGNSYHQGVDVTDSLNNLIFGVYGHLVNQLYGLGARNFLFLTVPPVDRSPLTQAQGPDSVALEAADIAAFNTGITSLATSLRTAHPGDANVFVYDVHKDFGAVLDNPRAFPQTKGYANTTNYCVAYQNGTPQQDSFTPSCGIPVDQYFWLNSLHPTYPVHDVIAQQVGNLLKNGPNVCGGSRRS